MRKKRRKNNKYFPYLFGAIVFIALCTFFSVWVRLSTVHLGYKLSKLYRVDILKQSENKKLKLKLATHSSPDRIEGIAMAKFGLTYPKKGQIVILEEIDG